MIWIYIGFALFFSMIFSGITAYILQYLTGGMYGPTFRKFPPALFVAINYAINLGIPLIASIIFVQKAKLKERLPTSIPGGAFFVFGAVIVLLPQALHIFTATVPGGGATFALLTLAAPLVYIGKILICIGAIRMLMAVKPSPEYVYQETQPNN